MFVERQTLLCKRGRYQELEAMLEQWSSEFMFPRAKAMRHYFSFIGPGGAEFCFELEFETLDDLQKGWEEWRGMAGEMTAYLEQFRDLIEDGVRSELWRVKTTVSP